MLDTYFIQEWFTGPSVAGVYGALEVTQTLVNSLIKHDPTALASNVRNTLAVTTTNELECPQPQKHFTNQPLRLLWSAQSYMASSQN